MNKTAWKEDLLLVIKVFCSVTRSKIFTLEQLKAFEEEFEHFKEIRPNNDSIDSSIRRYLQILRDDKIIEFIDNKGTYKLL